MLFISNNIELVVMEAESVSGRNTFTSSTSEEDEDEPPHKYTKLFSSYKKRRPNNANKTAASQLIRYLELTEQAEDTSLNFWVSHKSKLNILYPLAKKVLAVPASSAPVERVSSQGGLLMRPHRSRLGDKLLSELVMLKCNYKPQTAV